MITLDAQECVRVGEAARYNIAAFRNGILSSNKYAQVWNTMHQGNGENVIRDYEARITEVLCAGKLSSFPDFEVTLAPEQVVAITLWKDPAISLHVRGFLEEAAKEDQNPKTLDKHFYSVATPISPSV